jgi:2-phosphosulfolactate phosphatase
MRITEAYGIGEAPTARGHVVVIDVLRAFTTAAYAFGAGASDLVLVGTPEEAFRMRAADRELLLVGEVDGRPIPGFDFGNSPAAVERADLTGRRLVLRSTSGVQGALRALGAGALWLGSLVTAGATARAIARAAPAEVTLLAMGAPGRSDGLEDVACSAHLAALLRGAPPDAEATIRAVEESPAGRRARDPAVDWISPDDLACAISIDRFDFALRAERRGDGLVARPVRLGARDDQ